MDALFTRYLVVAFYLACAGGLLSACSPSEENEADYAEEQWEDEDLAEGDPYLQDKLNEGWRYGTLRVDFELHQQGENTVEQPATNLQGPSTTHIKWHTRITATREQRVLIQPDLSLPVPSDPDEALHLLESKPFYVSDSLGSPHHQSDVSHTLSWHHLEPESNQMIEGTRQATEQGIVTDLIVEKLNPSLYGPGWEAMLSVTTETNRTSNFTSIPPNNGEPVTINETFEKSEHYPFLLFPTPNTHGLNDYPYLDPNMPASVNESITSAHLDTLAMLQQLNEAPALSTMRIGLESQASKDQLTLNYSYSGDKQVPFWAGLDGLVAKPSANTLNIVIRLTAE